MARVKRGVATKAKHKKILAMAKGYRGRNKSCYTVALGKVNKGLQHAYTDRKDLKGNMRSLWIVRLNAECRNLGLKYSLFIDALKNSNVAINRKMLSEMCIRSPLMFRSLFDKVVSQSDRVSAFLNSSSAKEAALI